MDLAEIQLAAGNVDRAGEMLGLADGVSDPEWMKAHLLAYYRVASALHEAKNEPSVALEMLQRSTQLEHDLRGRQAKARLVALERHFAAELSAKTDEIHHLRTVELVAKNEQLSDLIHQNEEIRRVVVHDLRNPLAAVRMLSDLLLLDLADGGDADQVELVRAIQTATEEMNGSLVNLMTDREVLRDDPPMTVTAIVELCLGDLAQREEAPAVIIDASIEEVDLSVDGVLLRRAVGDVLTVVTSAARAGSVLGVDVGNTPAGVRITIVNEGRRIDELDTARDPLYVARRLIERMSGSLNVRSIEETGRTVVTIDLRS